MTHIRNILPVCLLILAIVPASTADEGGKTFEAGNAIEHVLGHYEQVRLALTLDSTDKVADAGHHILKTLEALESNFNAADAGVEAGSLDATRGLLPEIKQAASALAQSSNLESARDAFYEMSKPLVRWRKALSSSDRPVVAYCSMTRRSWLQPKDEELGNPYHGQSMLRCGQVLDS